MSYQIFHKVNEAWDSILHDIAHAEHSVLLNQFIIKNFEKGEIGRRLLQALEEASKNGRKVELLVDAYGSRDFYRRYPFLKHAEVVFHDVHPKWYERLAGAFFRDHRKLVVIDDCIVHIGGVVFLENAENWLDLQVRFEDRHIAEDAKKIYQESKKEFSGKKHTKTESDCFIWQGLGGGSLTLTNTIYDHMKRANKRIRILTPYFSPPPRFRKILAEKAKKNVDVQILVPIPSDRWLTDTVAKGFLLTMQKDGIDARVLSRMCHGKMVIVDDWVTFGSANFDRLSLFYDYELNFHSASSPLLEDLVDYFDDLLRQYSKPAREDLESYPPIERLIGRLARKII